MSRSRRSALRLLGAGLAAGVSGCSSIPLGGGPTARVTLANGHQSPHMVSVLVSTVPDGGPGFTTYFDDAWLVTPGEVHTFDQEITHPDHEPEVMALVALEDETAERSEFGFNSDLVELRVVVTGEGRVRVQPRTESRSDGRASS